MAKKNIKKDRPSKQTVTIDDINKAMVSLGIRRIDEEGRLVSTDMDKVLVCSPQAQKRLGVLFKQGKLK